MDYYRRAVELNPDLPEAVCGLLNSMASVCDWRGRSCYYDEYGVDLEGNLQEPESTMHEPRPGLMAKMLHITERQLELAYVENVHAMSATRSVDDWLVCIQAAYGRDLRPDEHEGWHKIIRQFYDPLDRPHRHINEAGFLLRLLDWLQPRLQRNWYIKAFGKVMSQDKQLTTDPEDLGEQFPRPTIPRTMSPPVVPSLLPFNTVCSLSLSNTDKLNSYFSLFIRFLLALSA